MSSFSLSPATRRKSHAFLRTFVKESRKGIAFLLVEIGINGPRFPGMYDDTPCYVYLRLFSESCVLRTSSL